MTNAELAQALRDLRDYLIVAGYEETHVGRYTHIARAIESWPEDINILRREARLTDIPGVGKTIAMYLKEFLAEGDCSKYRDWESVAPRTVLELVRIPSISARSAKRLFQEFGVYDLASLKVALEAGRLTGFTQPQMIQIATACGYPSGS
ncbi:MAG: hypothetical protein ACOYON_16535 [Fimbriimonas sp.]